MTRTPTTTITQADVPALLNQMTGATRQSVIASDSVSVPQLLQCLVDRGILAHPPPPPPPANNQQQQQQPPALDTKTLTDQAALACILLARLVIEHENDVNGTVPLSDAMRASASIACEELEHRVAIAQGALTTIELIASRGPLVAAAAPGRFSDLHRSACLREPLQMARLGRLQRRCHMLREDCAQMARSVDEYSAELIVSRAEIARKFTAALEDAATNASVGAVCDAIRDSEVSVAELERQARENIKAREERLRVLRDEGKGAVERIEQLQTDMDRLAILRIMVARADAGMT